MSTLPTPKPGKYRDDLGRVMIRETSSDGAWQSAVPKTATARHAFCIVAHRTSDGSGHFDGTLDAKAMGELITLGLQEGLIERNANGRVTNVDRFLSELRPFQLDTVLEGAQKIRALIAKAGSTRTFFEIRSTGGTWSDARANKMLSRLLGQVPPGYEVTPAIVGEGQDGPGTDVTPQIVGEGQDGPGTDVTPEIVGEGQDGPVTDVTPEIVGEGQDGPVNEPGFGDITAFTAGLGPESQS